MIPNKSIREGSYIYVVRDERLVKQNISISWQDDQNAIITGGVDESELVVTTSLNSTLAGARAKLQDQTVAQKQNKTPDLNDKSVESQSAVQ